MNARPTPPPNAVFVHGFPIEASTAEFTLRALFSSHGTIAALSFTERNGALVTFATPESLQRCLAAFKRDASTFTVNAKALRVCRARGAPLKSAPGTGGSKKRTNGERRSEKRREAKRLRTKAQDCHAWATAAGCSLGNACRFAHGDAARECAERAVSASLLATLGPLLRHQAAVRQRLVAAAAAASATAPSARLRRLRAPRPCPALEREYTARYAVDVDGVGGSGEDQWVQFHRNGVVAIGVASAHPLRKQQSSTRLEWDPRVAKLNVSGKAKHGSVRVRPSDALCRVVVMRGSEVDDEYTLRACIAGQLLEVDERIAASPSLLCSAPNSLPPCLAVLRPRDQDLVAMKGSLLTLDEYVAYCDLRAAGTAGVAAGVLSSSAECGGGGSGSSGGDERGGGGGSSGGSVGGSCGFEAPPVPVEMGAEEMGAVLHAAETVLLCSNVVS